MLGSHKPLALPAPQVRLCANGTDQGGREDWESREVQSVELCNKEVAQASPYTKGDRLNRVGHRFGIRSEVPATNSPIGGLQLHKDPGRKAIQHCWT